LIEKDDQIEISVDTSTWSKMYSFVGGARILLPFLVIIAFFA
jgi:hypothetical protein